MRAPLVRPYVMTGGRTTPRGLALRWETAVSATGEPPGAACSERVAIVDAATHPVSIAELSGRLDLPTAVVAVVVADLVAAGALAVHQADLVEVELSTIARMIERVRAL